MRNPSLTSDFVWTLLGNVVYSACQWGIVVLLAKMSTPEKVGEYAFAMAVASPVLLFATLQLRSLLTTDVLDQHPFSFYLGLRLLSMAASLLIVVAIAVGIRCSFQETLIISFVGVGQALEFISDIYYGVMQKRGRLDRAARSLMMKGPISLLALGLGLRLTGSVVWAVAALAAARGAVLLVYDRYADVSAPRFSWDVALPMIRKALPLGIVILLVTLNNNVPRYFIDRALSDHDLGIFSAVASLMAAGAMVTSALGQSTFVPIAQSYAERDLRGLRALMLKLVGAGILLGVGGIAIAILAGRQILSLVFRPEYGDHATLFIWLAAAAALGYVGSSLGYIVTAMGCFRPQVPLFLITGSVLAAACYLLIPRFGLTGAAMAMLVGNAANTVGGALVLFLQWRPAWGSQEVAQCTVPVLD